MCATHSSPKWYNPNIVLALAVILGLVAGYWPNSLTMSSASVISDIFINLLRLVSLPIIFLSIVATATGMGSLREIRSLGGRTVKYTLLTTVLAASIALILYIIIDPVQGIYLGTDMELPQAVTQSKGYLHHLVNAVPSNFVKPFVENNVISVLIIAILFSVSVLSLPDENRVLIHKFFHSLFLAIMKLTGWIVKLMPIAIWAFIVLFMRDLREGLEVSSLAYYLLVVVAANLIQAFVVLPTILKLKGLSPVELFKGMYPALYLAFFTKSSGAALPLAMQCAVDRSGVQRKVASFTLPLCTTINMNGCAAFILTTVLFVSMSHGMTYTPAELILWIFIATMAAVGNASVPMGCYFLSSAFLAAMDVPLNILGVILPFYTFIDMLETAINVWSDACVTKIVDKEVTQDEELLISSAA